ncbi:Anthranilate N-benzoyltransferase protein 2 [Madurella mycetomatis]|uniref:Anthranilate N-benzoyltransferase protein 2 n=1 Tax=Madurella mycetomatis TaxID=100816 RepID=A0A175VZ64_9PEZI|nr:Anthranilate N-benzoyltransferase protein 2 [Madurella mycetomatis]
MSSTVRVPLGVLDHFCPPNYTAISWYIPLKDGVTPQDAFAALRDGLRLIFKQLPWLSGKVYKKAPSMPGWRPGELEIRYEPADLEGDLPQFRFKQLDEDQLPMSYEEIKDCGFPMDTFADAEVLWGSYIKVPEEDDGAECFKAQANFLPGGVLLCGATHHNVCDGTSQFDVWRLWAANCNALQSGAAPEAPDPLSSDRNLIERIWAAERTSNDSRDMKPVSWTLLDMDPPTSIPRPPAVAALSNEETMQSAIFYMSPDKFSALHKKCVQEAGPAARISGNDALTAFIWRGLLKARRTAALNSGQAQESDLADVEAKLQLTLDGRPDISRKGSMPLIYFGNLVFMNLCTLPLATLTAPDTSVATVARTIRQTADAATSQAMLDAYALARGGEDFSVLGLRLSPLRSYDMILSSLIMFPVEGMKWGGGVFARGGELDALRPLWDEINRAARLCFPLPRKSGAGMEFVLNLFEDEMELLLEDSEFAEFAVYLSS